MHFNMKFLQHTIIRTSFQFSQFLLTKKIQDLGFFMFEFTLIGFILTIKCLFCQSILTIMEGKRNVQKPSQQNKDM